MQGTSLVAHPASVPRDWTGGARLRARSLLGYLAAPGVAIGLWQLLSPRSFYEDFPGFGRGWVAVDGPYNEHLVRDVGGGTLGLAAVALLALGWTTPALVRAAALGVLIAQGPHVFYHLVHVGLLPAPADRVLNTLLLGSGIVVPVLLLVGASRLDAPSPGADPVPALRPFVDQRTVLLTSHRRDGTPVGTPVHVAVVGGRAVVRTWDASGKFKRIRNNPEVTIAPSTTRGRPTGPAARARARILAGEESARAAAALARKHPVVHGVLVPLYHRLRRYTTAHLELTPVAGEQSASRSEPAQAVSSAGNGRGLG